MTSRSIRAGWKLTGINPPNIERIQALPQVQNLLRQTPDLIPNPTVEEGIYSTPKHYAEVSQIQSLIEAHSTPTTLRHVHKLSNAAVEVMTAYEAVKRELTEVRKRRRTEEEAKMSKRIKKNVNQRVWAIEEVIRLNTEADTRPRVRKVKKTKRKFIIAIRLPCETLAKLDINSGA
jgi:hypothetical protein